MWVMSLVSPALIMQRDPRVHASVQELAVTTSAGDLFSFLEADLVRTTSDRRPSRVTDPDPVRRALELATDEWSEGEAGEELAGLFGREELRVGRRRLFAALYRSPFLQLRGVRAARILGVALDRSRDE